MQKKMTKIGTVAFAILIPASFAEFALLDAGAKHDADGNVDASTAKGAIDEMAALGYANDYATAHITLGKVRSAVVKELKALGATCKVTGQDAQGKDITEKTDIKWIERELKASGMSPTEQQAFVQDIYDKIGFDLSGSRETKDYTNVDLKDAKAILEAIALGKSSYERVKANLEGRNKGLSIEVDGDGIFTTEALAAALKVERARAEAERQGNLL